MFQSLASLVVRRKVSKLAIKVADYNTARNTLIQAGSKTAEKSHPAHDKDVPDGHGKELLREARDEFREADKGNQNLKSEMTQGHYDAVHKAAKVMGITDW
jgi:hypothetical protein